jgi:hypothetical protein
VFFFVQDEQKCELKRTMQHLSNAVFEEEEEDPHEGWSKALGGWRIHTDAASFNSPGTIMWTDDLPDYVFERVVAHVQAYRAASVVFRQVCRAWREAHDRRVSVLTPKRAPPHEARAWRHFAAVKTLLLSAHVANDGVLIALAASFPLISLTSLSLWKFCDKYDEDKKVVPSVTSEGIKAISRLTTLTSLELNHCEGLWSDRWAGSLADLTALNRLSLAGCTNITNAGLRRALAPLTVLSSLSVVQYCGHAVDGRGVSALGL